MTEYFYTARRTTECDPDLVRAARAAGSVLELECGFCKAQMLAIASTYETGARHAASLGASMVLACRECTAERTKMSLELQTYAAAAARDAGSSHAIIAELEAGKGGDA